MNPVPEISIIVPSFKGSASLAKELPAFISFLRSEVKNFEIIVVDDGSNDNGTTKKVAEENQCTYLTYAVNLGKGGAVRSGMLHAKSPFRIFTDADIPFDFDAIKTFLFYLKEKEFDMVIGDRTLEKSSYFQEVTPLRKFASKIFTFVVGRFITTGNFDTQCGLKGFKGTVADDIFSVSRINGFTFDVETVYIALKRNYDIKRLPVKLRMSHPSSVNVVKHSIYMLIDLFRIKLNHVRGFYKKHA